MTPADPSLANLQVPYIVDTTVPSAATPGADYAALGNSVTFPIYIVSLDKDVMPVNDQIQEGDEFVVVRLRMPAPYDQPPYYYPPGYSPYEPPPEYDPEQSYDPNRPDPPYYIGTDEATVTIHDGYKPSRDNKVGVFAVDAYATESATAFQGSDVSTDDGAFLFSRGEGNVLGNQQVIFRLKQSAADANQDYVPFDSVGATPYTPLGEGYFSITIPSGESGVILPLNPINNSQSEWDESVSIELVSQDEQGNSLGYQIDPGNSSADVTILDDDTVTGLINRNLDPVSTSQARDNVGAGAALADVFQGQIALAMSWLPDGLPAYHGDDNLLPILSVEFKLPSSVNSITGKAVFAGLEATQTSFDLSQASGDGPYRFVLLASSQIASQLVTGHYDYHLEFRSNDRTRTIRGNTEIVNRVDPTKGDTEFGERWWLDGLDRLVPDDGMSMKYVDKGLAAEGGMALIRGDSSSAWFKGKSSPGQIVEEPEFSNPDNWEDGSLPGGRGGYKVTKDGDRAIYKFNGLDEDKLYEVFATWAPADSRSQAANYAISGKPAGKKAKDSTSSVVVDQRYTPGEAMIAGQVWRSLGFFKPNSSGRIVVTLTGAGELVADDMMVVSNWNYEAPTGTFSKLETSDGEWTLADKLGSKQTFNSWGMLTKDKDRNGNRVEFEYTDADSDSLTDELKKVTIQGGLSTEFVYNDEGYLETIKTSSGQEIEWQIESGLLNQITISPQGEDNNNNSGPVTKFLYAGPGSQLSSVKDPKNNETGIVYHQTDRRVTAIVDALGKRLELNPYLVDGLPGSDTRSSTGSAPSSSAGIVRKPANGDVVQQRPDGSNGVLEARARYTDRRAMSGNEGSRYYWYFQTDAFGYTTALAKPRADATQNPSTETNDVWKWVRDKHGNVTRLEQPAGGGGEAGDDGRGGQLSPLGAQTTDYSYDPKGNLTYLKSPDGTETTFAYDSQFAQVLLVITQDSDPTRGVLAVTTYELDANGNVAKRFERAPDGTILRRTDFEYTPPPTEVDDLPGGLVTLVTFAANTQSSQVRTKTEYYGDSPKTGLVKSVTEADGTSLAFVTLFDYDNRRNMTLENAGGRITRYEYDAFNQLSYVTAPDPDGDGPMYRSAVTHYEYDLAGNRTKSYDAAGFASSQKYYQETEYNALNLPIYVRAPAADPSAITAAQVIVQRYDYDENENLVLQGENDQRLWSQVYDRRNQLKRVQFRNPVSFGGAPAPSADKFGESGSPKVEMRYDAVGNLAFTSNPRDLKAGGVTVKTKYRYDAMGRRTSVIEPAAAADNYFAPTTTTKYDGLGRAVEITLPSNGSNGPRTIKNYYDALGRLKKVEEPLYVTTDYEYDDRDNLIAITKSYGSSAPSVRTEFYYDLLNRLIGVDYPDAAIPDPPPDSNFQHPDLGQTQIGLVTLYAYNAFGEQLREFTAQGQAATFGLVQGTPLSPEQVDQLAANDNGLHRLTTTYHDQLGRIVEQVSSDVDGSGPVSPLITDYRYDINGNVLSTRTKFSDANSGGLLASDVIYDRWNRPTNSWGPADDGGLRTETRYVYSGNDLVQVVERKPISGTSDFSTATTSYVYDTLGRRIGTILPNGETSYVFQDWAGNVIRTVDSDGNVTDNTYNFGNRLSQTLAPPARGSVPSSISSYFGGDARIQINYTYYEDGSVRSQTPSDYGADGRTEYFYGAGGKLTRQTQYSKGASGVRAANTIYSYSSNGALTSIIDPSGNVTKFLNDSLGRRVGELATDAQSQVRVARYDRLDAFGNVVQSIDRNLRTIQRTFDAAGHRTSEQWFDTTGAAASVGALAIPYPLTAGTANLVYSAQFGYGALGELTSAQDSFGQGENSSYTAYLDSLRRPIHVETTQANVTGPANFDFNYQQVGDLFRSYVGLGVAGIGQSTVRKFDQVGREVTANQTTWDGPGQTKRYKSVIFGYVPGSSHLQSIRRSATGQSSNQTNFTYFADGRLSEIDHPTLKDRNPAASGVTTYNVDNNYKYTLRGQVKSQRQSLDGTATFTYDAVNQLTRTMIGAQTELDRNYDLTGNDVNAQPSVLNRVVRDGSYELTYDNEGNLIQRVPLNINLSDFALSDPDSATTAQKYTNGGNADDYFVLETAGSSLTFTLQIPGKDLPAGAYTLKLSYPSNTGLNLTKSARYTLSAVTGHDLQNAPLESTFTSFTVDQSKPLSEQTGYKSSTSGGMTWLEVPIYLEIASPYLRVRLTNDDPSGQTKAIGDVVNLRRVITATQYSYDYQNRLVGERELPVVNGQPSGPSVRTADYLYNVLGERIGKMVDQNGDGTVDYEEKYINQGGHAVLTLDKNEQPLRRELWGATVDQLLARDEFENGQFSRLLWPLADHQGTVRDWAQAGPIAPNGQSPLYLAQHEVYSSFGNPLGAQTTYAAYAGQSFDPETRLSFFGGRYYDGGQGRFLSEDPLTVGANAYSLNKNSPTGGGDFDLPTPDFNVVDRATTWLLNRVPSMMQPLADMSDETTWGISVAVAVPAGFIAGPALVGAVGESIAAYGLGLMGLGGLAGATDAGLGMVANGGFSGADLALSTGSGFLNPINGFGGLAGGILGAGTEYATTGDLTGRGYRAGSIVGGLLSGGIDDYARASQKFWRLGNVGASAAKAQALQHAAARVGVEGGFIGAGAAIGYSQGGWDGALLGASLGQSAGSIAANYLVACFAAGTPIVVAVDGTSKPIEELCSGDVVLARDEHDPNGPLELKRIEEVFTRVAPIIELVVRGRAIATTPEHPFFVVNRGEFVAAKEIEPGEQFIGHDGKQVTLTALRPTGRIETVYNFRIADHHTYFIGGNVWGFSVWVHNQYTGFKSLTLKGKIQYLSDQGIEGADELLAKMNSAARNVRQGASYHAKRAVNYYLAGKLEAIEHGVNGGNVDLLLRTAMQVEAKSWWNAASIGKTRLDNLAKQIDRYLTTPGTRLRVEFEHPIADNVKQLLQRLQTRAYGNRLTWKQT
jgi:RHS repeat-associated protein